MSSTCTIPTILCRTNEAIIATAVVGLLISHSIAVPIFSHHSHRSDPQVTAAATVADPIAPAAVSAATSHAIIVVGGPTGIGFQSEDHVERFLRRAEGCKVFATAQPKALSVSSCATQW